MVAGSATAFSAAPGLGLDKAPAAAGPNKCRYKTGKCTNVRSSKRNGQPHQLCLYHRDKANKIQRKFDRQKRQVARSKKTRAASSCASASVGASAGGSPCGPTAPHVLDVQSSLLDGGVSPAGSTASTLSFSALTARDVDLYSDSECSRFSMDSDSSTGLLDSVWQDLPRAAAMYLSDFPGATPSPSSAGAGCHQSYLSSDEIEFLCSAILE